MPDSTIGNLPEQNPIDDFADSIPYEDDSGTDNHKLTFRELSKGIPLASTVAISSGNLAADAGLIIVQAETGTEDILDTINALSNYHIIGLLADAGDTIHVTHNSGGTGDILSPNGLEFELSENIPTYFVKIGGEWKWLYGPQHFDPPIPLAVGAPGDAFGTGDGQVRIENIDRVFVVKKVVATVETASSSGTPTLAIRDDGVDILSTDITIDANETTSETATTPPVIDSSKQIIAADSELHLDGDVAGTGAAGLNAYLLGYWRDVNW